ncbi:MAG: 50S ribosomal protein L16 [Phycisphaerales bacterium]|jgi:large subunit ribosomal protein L16|nr:50S ribosomal protein L16 [Phycisphaerales bacterium]MBT7171601.1 50S ribosomal protein L16 [Phycisphaerales bacterium]
MPLMPKRYKYRKWQRGKNRGMAKGGNYVCYGEYGLQCLELGHITARQIEAGRVAATQFLRREGKVYIRIFPHKPVTSKPLEVRMGKGKGEVSRWVAPVQPGRVLYEIGGVPEDLAKGAFQRLAHKMPVRCRMIYRRHGL